MIHEILILFVLLLIMLLAIKIILSYGGILLKIAVHLAFGWITLVIVNILPGIDVPINLVTLAISGFGGTLGTFILVLLSILF